MGAWLQILNWLSKHATTTVKRETSLKEANIHDPWGRGGRGGGHPIVLLTPIYSFALPVQVFSSVASAVMNATRVAVMSLRSPPGIVRRIILYLPCLFLYSSGATPIIIGVATLSSGHPTVRLQRSKMSASKKKKKMSMIILSFQCLDRILRHQLEGF